MDYKTELHNRIFTTERTRIKAEARLRFYEAAGQYLTAWYSVLLVVLTVFQNILRQHFHFVDETTIALSVTVLAFTIAFSGLRFGQRAELYKTSYHALQRLRVSLNGPKDCDVSAVEREYIDILDSSPNHKDQDYNEFIVQRSREGHRPDDIVRKPSKSELSIYFWRKAISRIVIFAAWLWPAVVAIWIYHVW